MTQMPNRGMDQASRRYLKIFLNLLIAVLVLIFVVRYLPRILVYFMPFVIGFIIALIASPLVRYLEEHLKIRRKAGTVLVIIGAIASVVFIIYGIVVILSDQIKGFISSMPNMWDSLQLDLQRIAYNLQNLLNRVPNGNDLEILPINFNIEQYISNIMNHFGTPTMEALSNFAKNIPSVIISVIMCALSSYFFIAEKDTISGFFRTHMPKTFQRRFMMVYTNMKQAVGGYFKAQFRIEVWMYLLLLVGLAVLGIDYAVLIALGIAIMDFLPFFGTGFVLIPWAVVKFLSADYKMAIGFLIIWGVGQLARQIIQPKIVGDSIGVPAIPTLFLLFIGYKTGGMIGMIIAVPIGIILIKLYQEGVFDTTQNSILLLVKSINDFRTYNKEDLRYLEEEMNEQMKGDTKNNESQGNHL